MRAREWAVGDKVEVYDPDEGIWLKGEVATVGQQLSTAMGQRTEQYMTVKTEGQAFGLPMVLALPVARTDLIRPRSS